MTADVGLLTLCTWTPECPRHGEYRVENPSVSGGSVEFVCGVHVEVARSAGYDGQQTTDVRVRSGGSVPPLHVGVGRKP